MSSRRTIKASSAVPSTLTIQKSAAERISESTFEVPASRVKVEIFDVDTFIAAPKFGSCRGNYFASA